MTPWATAPDPSCLTLLLPRLTRPGPLQYAFLNNQANKIGIGEADCPLLPVEQGEPG